MQIIRYDRASSLAYARRWAFSRNPEFYDFSDIGGDCTSFASQCVYAGAGVMNFTPTYGWYYISGLDKSPSWSGVNYFYDFMTTNEGVGPFGEEADLSLLMPGDIIQLAGSNRQFYHTLVLTGISGRNGRRRYLVSAHSNDAYMRPLSSYNYSYARGIHIIAVRTE